MSTSPYTTLKAEAYAANMELHALGLVIHTFGNVSAADTSRGVFAIKPSGVPYAKLRPEDMVVLDYNNEVVEGKLRPSSDTRTHSYLYREWEGLGGIAHCHALYSVAWAQAQQDIPILGTTHADHLTHDIPCAPPMADELIQGNYEHNTGVQITECFRERNLEPQEVPMVLVGNHGPFCWGKDAAQAVHHSLVLETVAQMAYLTLQINPGAPRLKEALIQKHYTRKHGKDAYYGQ
ncbi:L-ribulose-5-phosphate 4-epimerase [Robiginitalea sp. M366]|uniref:L-ribulose-5-phosphate 4-epimerase n=1 Tax=Robiginitalea aestuariiviva TaxID=3036903 RepID=UPI00240D0CBB|nr:L-ribulose-5-phosphate 4-epimerase [Robiginitalea aestuariiviva]MDG1572014.1 L-ribulose-5-phosphate 4-epimerase [Robiginitalea aestuariiviva]